MSEVLEGEVEFDGGIVPVGVLGRFDSFTANGFFEEVTDAESAKEQVSNMERLKKLMDAAEQYGQYASQFCEGECRLFFRIADVDGAEEKLTAAKRRMVEWIRSKTEAEKDEILDACKQGMRIHLVYNREIRGDAKRYDVAEDCNKIANSIMKEAMRSGRTTLNRGTFYERSQHPERLTSDVVSAYVEHTRDALLSSGVLGLGDGNGTYVMPEKCDRDEVAKLVKNRLESIVSDIKAIGEICKNTGFIVPKKGVELICELIRSLNDNTDVIDISL